MAANQERTLKVSFEGDAAGLSEVIQVVHNKFDGLNATIKSVSTTLGKMPKEGSEEVQQMVATVEILAKSLEHLEDLKGRALSGFTPLAAGKEYKTGLPTVRSEEDALVRREAADQAKADFLAQKEADNTAKKAAALRADLAIALKEQSKENVRTFYEELKSKEVLAQNGVNSIVAIKQREKDALLAAEREYNAKVLAYADRVAEGTRTEKQSQADMRKSEAAFERKVRSIKAEAATEIEIEKGKQDEIARLVKEQKATLAIATARQATDPQRMALIRAEVEEERAIQTRGFNDAYVRQLEYNRKRLQAEQALQQELAGIKTAQAFGKFTPEEAFTKSTAALATYKKALQDLPSLNKHVQEHQNLFTKVFELIGAYRILSTVWNTAVGALKAIPKIGIEMESTVASLTATTGSLAGAKLMLGALNTEAQRTGINIAVLRESFRNFYASTSTAGESLQTTWRVFTNLNTVITALHLSADQANGIFNAMAQIFNKSKVQSEELVKQLGNLLPGAFAAFAASMGISTQKLADDMKAGLVFAHDTIENFTEYLATKFYRAFDAAASGLNANVGRMQTSFTLLGEAIYKQSSGAMTDFVKAVTALADVVRGGVDGVNNFSYAIKGGFVVAAGLATGAIVNLVRWFGTLTTVMNLHPFVRFATLLGAAGAAIYEWKQNTESAYEGAAKRAEEYNTAIRNIPDYKKTTLVLDVEQTPEYKAIQADIAATQARLEEVRKGTKKPGMFGPVTTIDKQEITKVEQELTAHYGREIDLKNGIIAKKEIEGVELRSKMLDGAEKLALMRLTSTGRDKERAQKEYVKQFADEKAYFEKIRLDELAKRDGADKDILQQAETFLANYNAEYAIAGDKRKDTLHKQMQEEISLEKKTREDIIAATKDSLQHVDSLYKNSAISIAESITLKRTAIVEGLDAELKELEAQKSIAISYGDTSKARQYEVEMINAQKKAKRDLLALSDEEVSKSFDFADRMKTLQEAYDKARGTPSAATRFAEEEERLRAMEQTPTVKGQLDQITYIRNIEQSTAALGKLQTEQQMNTDEYNAKLQRINILKQNGLLGELSATQQLAKLDEENIALREKSLALREKEVEAMPVGTEKNKALVQLKRYKEETENLKITAASVGRLFEEKIGASFERTFTGLVQGTIRGKDAFKSFAASVVSDMISIVAQEARSAILQPLLKMGFSALSGAIGGMFGGSAVSVAAGNSASFASSMGSSNFWGSSLGSVGLQGNAVGGVYSGAGISAYSSSVVDKPTIFPFASGTGLMGEAGPEAIMPLQRINGKLGVRAEIAQSQSQTIVHSPVFNISMAKNDDPEGVGMKLAEGYIRGIARQEIVNSARIGGKTGQKLAT